MSNTKIVIDKEDWDKIASEFNSNDLPTATEIQIDQSIEERAETILKEHTGCEGVYLRKGEHFGETVIEAMVELATSQQIIEQEMEEFNLFVSANFMYSFEEKKWYHNNFAQHNSVHYEKHYTFTELLTKFKNR